MGVVRRYIDFLILLIPTPFVLALLGSIIPTSLFIFKMFFSFLFMLFLCNIANIAERTFKIIQKSRSCGHGDIVISTSTSYIRVLRLPRARYRVTFYGSCELTLCTIMAS